jgi:hypothetical protein
MKLLAAFVLPLVLLSSALKAQRRVVPGLRVALNYNLLEKTYEAEDGNFSDGWAHAYGPRQGRAGAGGEFFIQAPRDRRTRWRVGLGLSWHRGSVGHTASTFGAQRSFQIDRTNIFNRYSLLYAQLPASIQWFVHEPTGFYLLAGGRLSLVAANYSRWKFAETRTESPGVLIYRDDIRSEITEVSRVDVGAEVGFGRYFPVRNGPVFLAELRYLHGSLPVAEHPAFLQRTLEFSVGWLWRAKKGASPASADQF